MIDKIDKRILIAGLIFITIITLVAGLSGSESTTGGNTTINNYYINETANLTAFINKSGDKTNTALFDWSQSNLTNIKILNVTSRINANEIYSQSGIYTINYGSFIPGVSGTGSILTPIGLSAFTNGYTKPSNLELGTGESSVIINPTAPFDIVEKSALVIWNSQEVGRINFSFYDGDGYEVSTEAISYGLENSNELYGYLGFSTINGGTVNEKLRIKSSGDVNITTGDLYINKIKGSNPILTIDSTGKVNAVANWSGGGTSDNTSLVAYIDANNISMKTYVDSKSLGTTVIMNGSRKGRSRFYDDFGYYATARTEGVGICAAVSSGTAGAVTGEPYYGVIRFSDSTTANGGFYCAGNADAVYFIGGENLTFRFKVTTGATNVHHFGFSDSATSAFGTDYCEMYIADLKLQGTCKNNAGPTNTSAYTLTTATWYIGRIEAITNSNIQFSLWNAGMTSLLWNATITANIPNTTARLTRVMFGSYESTTGAAAIRSYLDFIDFWNSNEVQFS